MEVDKDFDFLNGEPVYLEGLNLGDIYKADGKEYKVSLPSGSPCSECDALEAGLCISSPACMAGLRDDGIDIVYKLIDDKRGS